MPTIGSETYSSIEPPESIKVNHLDEGAAPPDVVVGEFTPRISGLNPNTLPLPVEDAWIVIHGNQFGAGSVINWNDKDVDTEYVNEGKLRTQVSSDHAGKHAVYVKNGTLQSNTEEFTFTAPSAPEKKVEKPDREEHSHKSTPHVVDHGKGKSHTGPTGHGPKARR